MRDLNGVNNLLLLTNYQQEVCITWLLDKLVE